MADKKYIVGILIVLVSISIVYVTMGSKVRIRVDNDKTTFYVYENNQWVIGGREYNKLFVGTRQTYRSVTGIKIETIIGQNEVIIKRTTPYIKGPVIIDTYKFEGNINDVGLFPIYHTIELINASGFIYQYEARDLIYSGPTVNNVKSPQSFGRNIKIIWDEKNYLSYLYKSGILKLKYKPTNNYEVYNIRMFDPQVTEDVVLQPTGV